MRSTLHDPYGVNHLALDLTAAKVALTSRDRLYTPQCVRDFCEAVLTGEDTNPALANAAWMLADTHVGNGYAEPDHHVVVEQIVKTLRHYGVLTD